MNGYLYLSLDVTTNAAEWQNILAPPYLAQSGGSLTGPITVAGIEVNAAQHSDGDTLAATDFICIPEFGSYPSGGMTWSVPDAAPGFATNWYLIADPAGEVTGPIKVIGANGVLINGSASAQVAVGAAYGAAVLIPNGSGKYSLVSLAGGVTSVFGRTGAIVATSGDYSVSQITGAAPLASPALTGSPTAPTQTTGDNSTKIATDAFVAAAIAPLAPLASPALTGAPTAPTQSAGDSSTKVATTAYVDKIPVVLLSLSGTTTSLTAAQVCGRNAIYCTTTSATILKLPTHASGQGGSITNVSASTANVTVEDSTGATITNMPVLAPGMTVVMIDFQGRQLRHDIAEKVVSA